MIMKIRPAGHRVLVRLKQIKESKGKIVLPDHVKENHQHATQEAYVEALGITAYKGYDQGSPWCKVGDLVLIAKYSGEDRVDENTGEVYRIINDEDVFAILEEKK